MFGSLKKKAAGLIGRLANVAGSLIDPFDQQQVTSAPAFVAAPTPSLEASLELAPKSAPSPEPALVVEPESASPSPSPSPEPALVVESELEFAPKSTLVVEVSVEESVYEPMPFTELVYSTDRIETSVYRCSECRREVTGYDMRTPSINPKASIIPDEDELVGWSSCKSCSSGYGTPLASALRFSERLRNERYERDLNYVEECKRRMRIALHGDPNRSPHQRAHYLHQNSRFERAQRAQRCYQSIHLESTEGVFYADKEARQLVSTVKEWLRPKASKANRASSPKLTAENKRERRIKAAISKGDFSTAANRLAGARREFPLLKSVWNELQYDLEQAKIRQEQDALKKLEAAAIKNKIACFSAWIILAGQSKDLAALEKLLSLAESAFPSIDWDELLEKALTEAEPTLALAAEPVAA